MGNGITKLGSCCAAAGEISRRHDIAVKFSDPLDEGLGHSFCYVRPDPYRFSSSSKVYSEDDAAAAHTTPFFRSISGASVSANTSTPLCTALIDSCPYSSATLDRAAAFESSTCFASIPLQPVPRRSFGGGAPERGFLSGPIERGFGSGPIDRGLYSCPIEKGFESSSFSHGEAEKIGLLRVLRRAIRSKIVRGHKPIGGTVPDGEVAVSSTNLSSHVSLDDEDDCSMQSQNLQWAQGKAGEDRMQVAISEEHGWVFVGIYDGFNGPDAPDYLLSNLYSAVHKELKGLLWDDDKLESSKLASTAEEIDESQNGKENVDSEAYQKRWKCEWKGERIDIDGRLKKQLNSHMSNGGGGAINHSDVLQALSLALRKTEDAYLEAADKRVKENPELALMGSCVLVMLMKGEDVYLMNVGDSRAVLGRKGRPNRGLRKVNQETSCSLEEVDRDQLDRLGSFQLTMDHSTYEEEEVERIKNEHPDDDSAVMNERVKGYLKVTRAFGAGFLKQPKWNDALLEMFRIDYVGTSPYITCTPWLYHHKLGPRDRFLILSSDGLYQYLTNEEAISEVESFIASFPDGDPAQHLIEELLFRAAKKAGLDFHELLAIPQGDRRRYHDDVSIIIISLEGRIWRSSV